ncbi:CBS domain-containing protein [Actinomadura verrucosospora]|uniref:Putative signal transduction protein with CBS domains n=1 Tax=Actinomadura verrucosospora TaxID=46165 RepID=A0A7D4A4R7_ACTVE|nr:CBS domain-containing protein [Actinomadura verrucosospora]QKG22465.1 putative signal transduction protein with CBS domains [Actinomadura verrucosospora]
MPRRVSDVMTPAPQVLPLDATLYEAARLMRDEGIGDVLVTYAGQLCGMVTDRDIVVRAVAESRDTSLTPLGDVCTAELCTLHPEDDTETAERLMIERSVRRLPVVDGGRRPVGIVSIGDLAVADGQRGPLPEISKAPPNN